MEGHEYNNRLVQIYTREVFAFTFLMKTKVSYFLQVNRCFSYTKRLLINVTMAAYNGADFCELFRNFFPCEMSKKYGKTNIALCTEDGLTEE